MQEERLITKKIRSEEANVLRPSHPVSLNSGRFLGPKGCRLDFRRSLVSGFSEQWLVMEAIKVVHLGKGLVLYTPISLTISFIPLYITKENI